MVIRIEYSDGSNIELASVQTITLVARGTLLPFSYTFDITCFGNQPATHRGVMRLKILQLHS